ncbi:hypothetical protein QVH35_11065 [Candidatus Nitrosotenuis chungbukensis]|uniref:hypothetical protein n=1 Tax=Candidatus Nitrosotenuis chungbukensis TaxID=1353246 RepID=UPI0005B2E3FA|nr:hypothetical protein [Candidatus Nitrosotenuis chungbukensis]WKT57822.1 hypothetical protein QVH35_11065 [Candidatus Nitrosotenuis chungbukensis]
MMGKTDDNIQLHTAKEICEQILYSHSKVRSASICEDNGVIICSEQKNDNESLLSREEGHASLIQATARFFNRKIHDGGFGQTLFSLTMHEKIARVAIPLTSKHVILMSIENDVNHTDLILNEIYPAIIEKRFNDVPSLKQN